MIVRYGDYCAGRFCEIEAEYTPRTDDSPEAGPNEIFLLGITHEGTDIRVALSLQRPEEFERIRRECWARVLLELDTRAVEHEELRKWGGK